MHFCKVHFRSTLWLHLSVIMVFCVQQCKGPSSNHEGYLVFLVFQSLVMLQNKNQGMSFPGYSWRRVLEKDIFVAKNIISEIQKNLIKAKKRNSVKVLTNSLRVVFSEHFTTYFSFSPVSLAESDFNKKHWWHNYSEMLVFSVQGLIANPDLHLLSHEARMPLLDNSNSCIGKSA